MPDREWIFRLTGVAVGYRKGWAVPWRKAPMFWALRNVSFEVYRGETLGVIGSNGTGKSTLLRLLAGIYAPDRGVIERKTERVTMLSLGAGFDTYLTGVQNIFLNGLLLGMSKAEIEQKLDQIIQLADIGPAIHDHIRTYSTGMRARLGFAIAYVADPDVILLDETLGVGDEAFQNKSSKLIREKINSNHTVVLVSHNLSEVRDLCDRVIWIDGGQVMPEGSVDDTIQRYLLKCGVLQPPAAPPTPATGVPKPPPAKPAAAKPAAATPASTKPSAPTPGKPAPAKAIPVPAPAKQAAAQYASPGAAATPSSPTPAPAKSAPVTPVPVKPAAPKPVHTTPVAAAASPEKASPGVTSALVSLNSSENPE